jgi:two-component system chemotaxis sensor kinase CheA
VLPPQQQTTLHENIETLALEVTLRDLTAAEHAAPLLPVLAAIRDEADTRGLRALAAAVANTPDSESGWRDLVSNLQKLETPAAPAPAPLPLNQDPELVGDFILESREHLSAIEAQLLALEQNPKNADAVNTIFRGFHTMKGLAGFLEFGAIQSFTHEVETLLDLARNSKLTVDSALIDLILQSADYMRQALAAVENGTATPDAAALIRRVRERIANPAGRDLLHPAEAVAEPSQPESVASAPADSAAGPRAVKIDTVKLDYLVEMVGELAIAQAQVRHDPDIAALHNPRIARNLGQLNRITAEVQRVAMAMRMIPVSQLFGRMARLVRDLARKSGKQATLELSGEDTEIDRNMVEELADPLMHMIRNAVDHGAEAPEARIAAGKSPVARLGLKAWHTGGFINIEVSDDGRGLVREKILTKARERGLTANGDTHTDPEVFAFIFEPGFSTADKITDVSGRGVGMDVVRKHITKLRGRVDIASRPGAGSTFSIKLPLTMAVIDGLIVGVGARGDVHRYIVPLFAVRETLRPAPDAVSTIPDGGEMVLVRGSLLPILRLHRRFDIAPASEDPSAGILIAIESHRRTFCLLVDELLGKQEVVIKSLGPAFKDVTGVAGGSILGDGRVGLILDVEALF